MKNNIPKSEIFSISGIVILVLAITTLGVKAGSLSPSASPASTFYTLSQIFNPLASTSYDSSGFSADQNGSLIEMLKYTNSNLGWASSSNNVYNTSSRVGIGTSSPTTKFEVQGTASASYGIFGSLQVAGFSSASYSRFGTSTTTHSNYISSANDLLISGDLQVNATVSFGSFASIGNTLFVDASSKRVGIGTTSPASQLQLGHTTAATQRLTLFYDETNNGEVLFQKELDGGGSYGFYLRHVGNGSDYFSILSVTGGGETPVLQITRGNNNVYIGSAVSASTKLEVQGTASASHLFSSGGLQVVGTTGASVSYSRFGISTTTHTGTINTPDDLLISGGFEVNGSSAFDSFVLFGQSASIQGNLTLSLPATGTITEVCYRASGGGSGGGGGFGTYVTLGTCSSSLRYKEDIQPLEFNLEDLYALSPVDYKWKNRDERNVGFIAEEVEPLIPELVFYNDEGTVEGINYSLFAPYFLTALKDHEARLDTLEAGGNSNIGTSVLSESNESLIASILDYFENTLVKVKKLIAGVIEVEEGIILHDKTTGEPYCVTIDNGQLQTEPGNCTQKIEPTPEPTIESTPEIEIIPEPTPDLIQEIIPEPTPDESQ